MMIQAKIEDQAGGFLGGGQGNPLFSQGTAAERSASTRSAEKKKQATGKAAADPSTFDENDESGLDPKEIELVMAQVSLFHAVCVKKTENHAEQLLTGESGTSTSSIQRRHK